MDIFWNNNFTSANPMRTRLESSEQAKSFADTLYANGWLDENASLADAILHIQSSDFWGQFEDEAGRKIQVEDVIIGLN